MRDGKTFMDGVVEVVVEKGLEKGLEKAVEVVTGDITALAVDAIVNAANEQLQGGGGVDGAIHRAAGWQALQTACQKFDGCPTGEVRVTPGFALPVKAIIHAVGPVWRGGHCDEDKLLASCYRNAMRVAQERAFHSIAFPAISCGVYRFPVDRAVHIAVAEVFTQLALCPAIERVVFCCFDDAMASRYRQATPTLRHLASN